MKILTLMVAFAAASVFADVTTANVIGILRVDSSAKQTIVSIPWLDASVSGGNVKVCDIVKTANLKTNDRLMYYNNGSYQVWTLSEEKTWVPANMVNDNGSFVSGNAEATLARGNALLLVRDVPGDCFYICGQVGTSSELECSFAANAWSLIAPPTAGITDLNVHATWTNVGAGDKILIPGAEGNLITLTYESNVWGWKKTVYNELGFPTGTEFRTDAARIPAGQGAWYKSGSDTATVTWKTVPSTSSSSSAN